MSDNMFKYKILRRNVSPAYISETREIFDERPYLKPRTYTNNSRYGKLRRLHDDEKNKMVHENWNQRYIPLSNQDTYYTVTIETENRLDMISQEIYNTPRYWWVLALANYLTDPFDVPVGTTLRVPPITSLYNGGGILYG